MAAPALLCLKCRRAGHNVETCPVDSWAGELDWFFSTARTQLQLTDTVDNTDETICSRCKSLDLIGLLEKRPPWKSQKTFPRDLGKEGDVVKSLGKTGSVHFRVDCSMCYCLFVITPQPSSLDQEISLVPDWTISRVSGELGAVTMDSPDKSRYTTCLLSVLNPSSISLPSRIVAHRGDAICLLEKDIETESTLGGRVIDSVDLNVNLILEWVQRCEKLHDESCLPVSTEALSKIRLVEIESRRVVEYPDADCEYVALSYVFGNVGHESYRLGDTVKALPKTLEDALAITRRLGKSYVWIDSVCIDQSDKHDKIDQINRMWEYLPRCMDHCHCTFWCLC